MAYNINYHHYIITNSFPISTTKPWSLLKLYEKKNPHRKKTRKIKTDWSLVTMFITKHTRICFQKSFFQYFCFFDTFTALTLHFSAIFLKEVQHTFYSLYYNLRWNETYMFLSQLNYVTNVISFSTAKSSSIPIKSGINYDNPQVSQIARQTLVNIFPWTLSNQISSSQSASSIQSLHYLYGW